MPGLVTRSNAKVVARTKNMEALRLYRSLLRLHRKKLPSVKRQLGDAVIRKEFRDHVAAEPAFVNNFMSQWSSYRDVLAAQTDTLFGQNLSEDEKASMTAEQQEQLKRLADQVTL